MEDKEILEKFQSPVTKNQAFTELVTKYQERIYWHVRKMVIDHEDANDITQDVFIKAYNGLIKFKGESQLFTWIYRIATNECLNFLTKKKKRFFTSIQDITSELEKKLTSSSYINGDEIQIKLQKALLQLPEKQRLVFNMKYFDDMKYDDISKILETSVGALKASYHHATKKIETYLNED